METVLVKTDINDLKLLFDYLDCDTLEQLIKKLNNKGELTGVSKIEYTINKKPVNINKDDIKLLGQGSFGQVFKITVNDQQMVVKINEIDEDKLTERLKKDRPGILQLQINNVIRKKMDSTINVLKTERKIMETISGKCEGIPKYFDYQNINIITENGVSNYRNALFTEYIEGTTLGNIKPENLKNFISISKLLLDYLTIINCLHSKDIGHRDIKPDNTIIKNGSVYLIDYGLACFLKNGEPLCDDNRAGTLKYMAPEMLNRNKNLDITKCDIFSIGVIMYYYTFDKLPFVGNNPEEFYFYKNKIDFDSNIKYTWDKFDKDTIIITLKSMLEYDPNKRKNSDEILKCLKPLFT